MYVTQSGDHGDLEIQSNLNSHQYNAHVCV